MQDLITVRGFVATDPATRHILAFDGEQFAGCARVFPTDTGSRFGRFVVHPDHRGSGLGPEIVRAGIESIGHGQTEAARALGLHRLQAFRLVVLPQALRAVVPPLGSQFILLMLNSSIVSVISANELTAVAQDVQSRTFRAFEAYIVAAVIYFALSMLFSGVFAAIERFAFARPASR